MNWQKFFKIRIWKVVVFFVILIIGILTMKGPVCEGGPCEISLSNKIISYGSFIVIPGTSNLFSDNGFFVGYSTYGIWDAIPQLIFHVGVDLLYWYIIICFLVGLIGWVRRKARSE